MTRRSASGSTRAVFPGLQGGPLMHVIAAKAVALRRGAAAGVHGLRPRGRRQRADARRRRWSRRGLAIVSGGTDSHLMLVDLRPLGLTGRDAETGARARRHHLQQERHPVRPAKADGDLGHPPRLAGGDDARLRRGGVPHRSGAGSSRCCAALARQPGATMARPRRACARKVGGAVRPLSDLSAAEHEPART